MSVPAAVLTEVGGPLAVEEITLAPTGPDQVRVRLAATGVCHSDLSLANGTLRHQLPVVLGHEGAGRVIAVGDGVRDLRVGDPVVLNWAPACRTCWFCRHGEPYLCENAGQAQARRYASRADGSPLYPGLGVGAFATETVVDEHACVRLPDDIPLVEAALLGCAVLTGVGAVRNAARVRPGEAVLVIGLGGVGLAAVQGARIAGAGQIIAVDPAEGKRDLALRLGATDALAPGADLSRQVRHLCAGRGADHAIECVGRAETIRAAWSATRRGGHTTVVGLGQATDQVTFNALELGHFARTLSGCMYGSTDPAQDLPFLVECYRRGALDLRSMVGQEISLTEVGDAFTALDAGTGAGARSVVVFDRAAAP
ncbi:MAG TPA: Zn-dependent alcohol dehydrogenase [Micromonosporaceae bacterium]